MAVEPEIASQLTLPNAAGILGGVAVILNIGLTYWSKSRDAAKNDIDARIAVYKDMYDSERKQKDQVIADLNNSRTKFDETLRDHHNRINEMNNIIMQMRVWMAQNASKDSPPFTITDSGSALHLALPKGDK